MKYDVTDLGDESGSGLATCEGVLALFVLHFAELFHNRNLRLRQVVHLIAIVDVPANTI